MDRCYRWVVVVGLVLVLAVVNVGIYSKEQLRAKGEVVYLALAPVDPRSLIQGDYMALRFALTRAIRQAVLARYERHAPERQVHDGSVVVALDERGVARFARLSDDAPLTPDERRIDYRWRQGEVRVATDAFYFQEGTAERYEAAEFGRFRLSDDGELLLTGLVDENLEPLTPGASAAPL
ncbi:hypothetical protein CF392_08160 [Tamilnaduibacter salinus]|uniref:Membrane-anchored protein n=1 Tax=Tamilnaduibacter salinus TaxID=1484056 RepID=A0A2A2I2J8_9GAMM|nr:GDYXXLXY domain-containing protein [Tamilnaduibacter salinus]PAV25939.1 hypothetical protein CF392_08160 [Tamilnaduibacter salinus]